MTVLSARFGNCRSCGRLITVGGLNPNGDCTKDCGGSVNEPRKREPCPAGKCLHSDLCIGRRWCTSEFRQTLDRLAVVHSCPDSENCSFGNEGCQP